MVVCSGSDGSFTHGLHFADDSPFSYEGKPLPYVKAADPDRMLKQAKRNLLFKREPDMLYYYDMLKGPHDSAADVKVENIQVPVLLISGGEDMMVPADWVCEEVIDQLDARGFAYPHKHLNYPVLSHYTYPIRPISNFMFKVERKHKAECDRNREQSWQGTLQFLREDWRL